DAPRPHGDRSGLRVPRAGTAREGSTTVVNSANGANEANSADPVTSAVPHNNAQTEGSDQRLTPRYSGRRTVIRSLATYVPPRILTNADLERMVETSDEWILQRTGIRERHIVDPGIATSDLAKEAALEAIRRAGLTPNDIGLIVVGTVTPDMMFP